MLRMKYLSMLALLLAGTALFAQKGDSVTHCDPTYNEDVGPMMNYPDGTDQVVSFDCSATISCDAYFDAVMSAGQELSLATCGADWDTGLSTWSGALFDVEEACVDDSCSLQTELTFTAPADGTYRFRIGGFGGASGPVDVVYNGTPGVVIVGGIPAIEVPTLSEYGMGALLLILALAGVGVIRSQKA